jgi:hypothetical protein
MDYSRVYRSFIEDRRTREDGLEAFDRHHIVPRCLGGGDEPENIIRLSYADHLFAHVLLAKIHGPPLVMPAVRMSGMSKYNGGRSSRERYSHLRSLLRAEMLGNKRKLGKAGMSEEGRRRLSEARKGNSHSKGRVLTDTHKARISASMKRRFA